MNVDIKKKHHYVYRKYLESWVRDGSETEVYYLSKKGKISSDSVTGILREDYFYKFNPLRSGDKEIFELYISKFSPVHWKSSVELLNFFLMLSKGYYLSCDIGDKNLQDSIINNTIEDIQSSVELDALPSLKKLWRGDLNALDDKEERRKFCLFLSFQALRNKGPRDETIARLGTIKHENTILLERSNLFFERNWNLIMIMLASNMAKNIFDMLGVGGYCLLKNSSAKPFITSDRPVNNVHPDEVVKPAGTEPESIDFYYPLSPGLAFYMPESKPVTQKSRSITESEADRLNTLVAKAAFKTIVSNNEESIVRYKRFIKR
ncbi:DUF4238 domain-containing protein [Aquipseudomonas guryensis]|uniref:DUF4238 domain-containing protein n=1 Tax=Aquipseudomonas guryensis TaxID=2759165 RepID=A0A7W4DBE3_9GAMM|nr:DUF4238 domain-containing protein [Pseudomonas guryensis]MBB1519465.1 DUF4238 domain-containing protein [Pseudomonas guryensis]